MAEFVNEMKERMLPEYEMLRKFEICTDEQIKNCMRQRENFQIKITQSQKSMRDFADYIMLERTVHKWITEKERATGIRLSNVKSMIVTRICKLYRDGLCFFPQEERFWQNYLKFCKKSVPHEVCGIYEKMLSYHNDKPQVWCDAALWVYEYSLDMNRTKNIFLRALQRHQNSECVNKTFFDILLLEASKLDNERKYENNTVSEQDIALERVALVYKNSKMKISNIEYYLSLIEHCEDDKFKTMSAPIQKMILDDIIKAFPLEELLWDALAQRELRGFNMCDLSNIQCIGKRTKKQEVAEMSNTNALLGQINQNVNQNSEEQYENDIDLEMDVGQAPEKIKSEMAQIVWKRRTLKSRIELCVKVYQTAVQTLKTTKMWNFYINAILKLNQDMSTQPILKRKCLAVAFKEGHISGLMDIEHYKTFVNMLLESKNGLKVADSILSEAVKKQKSVKLYELWLSAFVEHNNLGKAEEIFDAAKKAFSSGTLLLYQLMIGLYKTRDECDCCTTRLINLYKEASRLTSPEFGVLRAEYLDFCMLISSIVETRTLYDELVLLPPFCLEMHEKMIEIESHLAVRTNEDFRRWRMCHANAVHYFGKTNVKVWIEYIKFERDHGLPKNMSRIFENAKAILNKDLLESFSFEHTILTTHF